MAVPTRYVEDPRIAGTIKWRRWAIGTCIAGFLCWGANEVILSQGHLYEAIRGLSMGAVALGGSYMLVLTLILFLFRREAR